ncbi:hypothetical protein ACFL03_04055 [Thermodesulfobacteriota bacterium]
MSPFHLDYKDRLTALIFIVNIEIFRDEVSVQGYGFHPKIVKKGYKRFRTPFHVPVLRQSGGNFEEKFGI